ncbi:hypothetical protein C4556_01045 [Candidatus Parcubacteria bacterium]|nr:MAG: hypothetical protein C4556_01045 [Candidatus Parcubacteria bacterium]
MVLVGRQLRRPHDAARLSPILHTGGIEKMSAHNRHLGGGGDSFDASSLNGKPSDVGFLGLPAIGDPVIRFFRKLWAFIRG